MSKARILADMVGGGTTAAEFDYLDGVTSNIQTQFTAKAPVASPVLVTPNLGTPSAGVVTNLSGVLPVGVTGGSGLASLPNQILQVVNHEQIDQIGGAYNTEVTLNCFCDITIKNTTSNLLIIATPEFSQHAAMRAVHLKIEYKTADGSGRDATAGNYTEIADYGRVWGQSSEGFDTPCIQAVWDHNQSVDTVKNIAITATGFGTNGAGLFYNNNAGTGRSNMTIFEVLGTVAA